MILRNVHSRLEAHDVLHAPWNWRLVSRVEACRRASYEPVVIVTQRRGAFPVAEWFGPEHPFYRGFSPFELQQARYYCYVGREVSTHRHAEVRAHAAVPAPRSVPTSAPAPVPRDPSPPPEPARQRVCELLSVEVECGHNGRKARNHVLEVVPGADGDRLKLSSNLKGGCGHHTQWEISGQGAPQVSQRGTTASHVVEGWALKTLLVMEVLPREYTVAAMACQGHTHMTTVRVFPRDKITVSIERSKGNHWSVEIETDPASVSVKAKGDLLRKTLDTQEKLEYVLEKVLAVAAGPERKLKFFPKFVGKFDGKWEEHASSHRAFYKYSASIEAKILEASLTIPFGPTAAIPPSIKKWATDWIGDFYIYLKFDGSISLTGEWARKGPDEHKATINAKGKLGATLGASIFLMKKGALNVDINGSTGFKAKVSAPIEKHPTLEFDLECEGLEAEITIEAVWGMVEYKKRFGLIEGGSVFKAPRRWQPFKPAA